MRQLKLAPFQMTELLEDRAPNPDLPSDIRQFNETIGLPVHPLTNLPTQPFAYQVDFMAYKGKRTISNKSRKIGWTEAVLRKMVYHALSDCAGYQLLLAAQDELIATQNMKRLQDIFELSDLLRPLVVGSDPRRNVKRLDLKDGTQFFVMPRRAAKFRSWPRVKYIFPDEASHFNLLDDEPFLAAAEGSLANTDGYMDIVSTPNGQRGFFYRLFTGAVEGANPYKWYMQDYNAGIQAGIISEAYIEEQRTIMGDLLFSQEFECKFVASGRAAFPADLIDRSFVSHTTENLD